MNTNLKTYDDVNFIAEVVQAKDIVLVDFWAPWCGPCNQITPILEDIGKTLTIGKVNIDENPTLTLQYNVGAIPTLLLFKNGEMVRRLVGVHSKDTILAEVARFQDNTPAPSMTEAVEGQV